MAGREIAGRKFNPCVGRHLATNVRRLSVSGTPLAHMYTEWKLTRAKTLSRLLMIMQFWEMCS